MNEFPDLHLGAPPQRSEKPEPVATDAAIARHTPGPWRARRREREIEKAYLAGADFSVTRGDRWSIDADDEWLELATVYASGGEFCEDSEANAHLIAAAPDLLKAAHWSLARLVSVSDLRDENSEAMQLQRFLLAVIAKAEGR